MAVQSTLFTAQNLFPLSEKLEHSNQLMGEEGLTPPHAIPPTPILSTLHESFATSYSEPAVVYERVLDPSENALYYNMVGQNPGSSPQDGGTEKTWYCSACQDGPIGSWQNCCVACGHTRCGSCRWEERKT
jgi:hypothetical protein